MSYSFPDENPEDDFDPKRVQIRRPERMGTPIPLIIAGVLVLALIGYMIFFR